MAALEQRLGLRFRDRHLLLTALVHRSVLNERTDLPGGSNERLEFLGDALLGAVVAERLYQQFPQANEGLLTLARARLVCAPALAVWARQLALGQFLLVGRGEELSGVRERDSTLASAFEALVAAIYLDAGSHGWARVRQFLDRFLTPALEALSLDQPLLDVKSRLQQRSQAERNAVPVYRVVSTEGPQHSPTFTVAVYIGDAEVARGTGRSKQAAERAAAAAALAAWDAPIAPPAAEDESACTSSS
ncbi:MAG TPA: ribonuclease III [Chloroflexota bacterium]|nr:ribonuclease III [Chloroflexota bacterium]